MNMPDVDQSRVFLLGFSNGGFFAYALMCDMGDRIRAIVTVATLWEQQPAGGVNQRTNVLALQNANDNLNRQVDTAQSSTTEGGDVVVHPASYGTPTGIRTQWFDSTNYPT